MFVLVALALAVCALAGWWATFAVLSVLALAAWGIDVALHPFAPCRRCGGSGTSPGSRASAYGLCPHGSRRVRFAASKAAARHQRRGR